MNEMNEMEETEEIYIPLEKRKQTINDLKLFEIPYKNGILKNY